MPRFRYIVVNKENRQLSGSIESPDIDTAREEIKALGFSIVSIEQAEDTDIQEEGMEFRFKGIDKKLKTIIGTIKSDDRYHAFKRLITEYELDIEYLVQTDLPEEEQQKQENEGAIELMKQYRKEVEEKTDKFHKEKIGNIDRNFEKEKARLMRQIDFVLKKVSEAVDDFGQELKPGDKKTIVNYVNKILRLKHSTNLEYIKTTCESLLKFLQNAEIFVHKKEMVDKKIQLYVESEEMLKALTTGKDFEEYEDLEDKILKWQKNKILGRKKISLLNNILNGILTAVLQIIQQPEEIKAKKAEIHNVSMKIREYYMLYLKSKEQTYRNETTKIIKKLKGRKILLNQELKALQTAYRKASAEKGEKNAFERSLHSINGLTGWLLAFYLTFYFASYYIVSKQIGFPLNDVPSVFYLFQNGIIRYILPVVFLLHASTSLKLSFFRKEIYSSIVILPLFIIGSFLILFNF